MAICPLYEEPEAPVVETFVACAEPQRPIARLADAIWSGILWRTGCAIGLVVSLVWSVALVPLLMGATLVQLLTWGRFGRAKRLRLWGQFRFISMCGLGALVSLFSMSLGITLLCVSVLSQQEQHGLVDLVRSLLSSDYKID